MSERQLGVLAWSSWLVLGCVPKVSASIVVDPKGGPDADAEGSAALAKSASQPKANTTDAAGTKLTPPVIVRAELLGGGILRLHLSEPLGPTADVDPNDFRVSVFNRYIDQQGGYAEAYYYDFGSATYGQALRFTGLRAGTAALDLFMEPEVPPMYCRPFGSDYNDSPPGTIAETGLFLHYAAGAVPVRDASADALANFGADWVVRGRSDPPETRIELSGGAARAAGRDLIPIACGPVIPPGPR